MKKFIALSAHAYKLKKGIIPVSLTWKTKTIQGWCDKVVVTKKDIVIGHSIGGAVALIVAGKTPPKELHLYAPTPIFSEFSDVFKKSASSELLSRINQLNPIPKISCPVYIYVGDQEHPQMISNVKK
jgi:esterase/lipase